MAHYGDQLVHSPSMVWAISAVFDMAFTNAMTYSLNYHESLVYNSYEDYLNNKYDFESFIPSCF